MNYNGDINFSYNNSKLILDKSGKIVNDVETTTVDNINSFTLLKNNLKNFSNYEFIFIKNNSSDVIEQGVDIL